MGILVLSTVLSIVFSYEVYLYVITCREGYYNERNHSVSSAAFQKPQALGYRFLLDVALDKYNARGYNWATLFLAEINTGTWPSRLGIFKKKTVKYCHESRGARTREILHWRNPATTENYRADLSSERAPHINKPITV
jgi:hypothetical protein